MIGVILLKIVVAVAAVGFGVGFAAWMDARKTRKEKNHV
jgi:hypothetical protein